MKFVICFIFFLTVYVASSIASTAIGQYKDPKHPGKCTLNENLILSYGEQIKDPNMDCGRIICGKDGWAEFQTCGVESMEGCKSDGYLDASLPYPACCQLKWICA